MRQKLWVAGVFPGPHWESLQCRPPSLWAEGLTAPPQESSHPTLGPRISGYDPPLLF